MNNFGVACGDGYNSAFWIAPMTNALNNLLLYFFFGCCIIHLVRVGFQAFLVPSGRGVVRRTNGENLGGLVSASRYSTASDFYAFLPNFCKTGQEDFL